MIVMVIKVVKVKKQINITPFLVIVLFAYAIMLSISTRKEVTKTVPKKLYSFVILTELPYAIKMSDKILFHRHFRVIIKGFRLLYISTH